MRWLLLVWALCTSSLVALLAAAVVGAWRAVRRERQINEVVRELGREYVRAVGGDDVTQPFGGLHSRRARR